MDLPELMGATRAPPRTACRGARHGIAPCQVSLAGWADEAHLNWEMRQAACPPAWHGIELKEITTMATAQTQDPGLTGEQLSELLRLIKGADSVELKLTVPDTDQRSAIQALGIDPLDAQIRQVVFFDTADLVLYQQGVVVRARRVQGKGDDSVVKLRPVVPDELPAKLRKSPNFGVEVDAMPGGFVCSASLKAAWGAGPVKKVLAGDLPIRKAFTKEQRAFYDEHAPSGIALDDLLPLGPINVLKVRFVPDGLNRRHVAELWFYPNGSRILELSTKVLPAAAFQAAAESRAFLAERGVAVTDAQQTKTRTALEYYAKARRSNAA
jgi:hypothetical protein